jgi:putative membrane protein
LNIFGESLHILKQISKIDPSQLVIQSVAMALTALFIPKLRVTSIFGPLFAVLALALINTSFWSNSLFSALPDSLSTRALSLFLINGLIFWVVVKILPGIECKGILPALLAPIVFTICSMAVPHLAKQLDWGSISKEGRSIMALP